MTDTQPLCGFKPPEEFYNPDYQCRHPVRQDGLCLFHLFKPTEEQKQAMVQEARTAAGMIEEKFRQAFSELLENEEKKPETKECDFRYFRFPAIDLSNRRFAKLVDLSGATFSGKVDFGWSIFSRGAGFSEATFIGEANFRRATFSGKADFGEAIFIGEANFRRATFNGEADFRRATFRGGASFSGATFNGWTYFRRATFSGKADFSVAILPIPEVDRFVATTFRVGAYFGEATFSGKADFGEAIFIGEADFRRATFSGGAGFREETFKAECRFTGVALDEKAEVVFEKTNLTQVSFLDTNLERIHFRDVDWPRTRKGRRLVLWDEFPHEEKQPDYEKVAENYRQLVLNYEAKRDFDTAEKFHIGEMEMRRKKIRTQAEDKAAKAKSQGMKTLWRWWGTLRERINGYSIYKISNNYGTSYGQGLLVLLVLLVLFSGVFLWSGLKLSKEVEAKPNQVIAGMKESKNHKDSLHDINYELCLRTACKRASWRQKVDDSTSAFLFTLSLLTFQKERLYEPANKWTQFWVCIAVLFMAGQTALVLFAIRRRFKR